MSTELIEKVEVKEDGSLVSQSNELVEQAESFKIENDLDCKNASDILVRMKAFIDGPGTYHDEEITHANRLHKLLCDKRNNIIDGPKQAYKILKDRVATWIDNQRRKREEEERKAQSEAQRIEDEKKAKIQAQIYEENRILQSQKDEEERIQKENDRKIRETKYKQEKERLRKEEEDRRIEREKQQKIDEAAAQRKAEELKEKKENTYIAPKPVAPVSIPKGISVNYEWEPEVFNKALVPDIYKIVDLAGLKRDQKSRKGELSIPGVRFIKRAVGSQRRSI